MSLEELGKLEKIEKCCGYKGPSPCFIVTVKDFGFMLSIGRCLNCGELQVTRVKEEDES